MIGGGLGACGGDPSSDDGTTSGATQTGTETSVDDSSGASNPSGTSGPSSQTEGSDGSDGTGAPTTDATDDTSADSGSTTGDPNYCGLDVMQGEDGPWFELSHMGVPVTSGATLTMECGAQGSLMFWLESHQGGVMPDEFENITYSVTMDVPGFDDLSPTGHFYRNTEYGMYVGCEPIIGGITGGVPVLPPDALLDVTQVDGLPATLHVELAGDGATAVFDVDVVLAVPSDLSPDTCFGAG
jgi:hypothetical protein